MSQVARKHHWFGIAAMACPWLVLVYNLRTDWSAFPQYAYGWLVPLASAWLVWRRWQDRPAPNPGRFPQWTGWLVGLACAWFLPIRLIQEANPDWRLITWLLAVDVVWATLVAIYYVGGRIWMTHFAFPVLFFFCSVPWPHPVEEAVLGTLMPIVTRVTIEGLLWLNVPSVRQGYLIEVWSGSIGVDDVSNGLRTLQGTLMAALFLGEWHRATWLRRLILLLGGGLLALALNTGRTFFLAFLASRKGLGMVDAWQGLSGWIVVAITLVAMMLLAKLLRGRPVEVEEPETPMEARHIPAMIWACVPIGLIVAEFATEAWYRSHERDLKPEAAFSVDFNRLNPKPVATTLSSDLTSVLGADEVLASDWKRDDGLLSRLVYLRWGTGNSAIKNISYLSPDICLPGVARILLGRGPVLRTELGGEEFFVQMNQFSQDGKPLRVFLVMREDFRWPDNLFSPLADSGRRGRISRVAQGRRARFGVRMLQVFVPDIESSTLAEESFRHMARTVLGLTVNLPASGKSASAPK